MKSIRNVDYVYTYASVYLNPNSGTTTIYRFTPIVKYADLSCIIFSRYGVYTLDSNITVDKVVQAAKVNVISLRNPSGYPDINVILNQSDSSYFQLSITEWNCAFIFGKSINEFNITLENS